ncbi:MAG TPA: aminotransferase class I/II-fold pyridoxal phosphate-dependent enzyme [Vicinamibacterales bacterium]|nr:aminotransferase class I/II-fold pyridoxal phosphate-dependent enzyme [Vicinamibacterales bacterium]
MRLDPFAMERMQSTYEHQVDFNLSESGVHPMRVDELLDDTESRAALLAERLRYTQTNGTEPLRMSIAALYPGVTADHIQVTNGGAEANYMTTWHLVEPGDEVVMMVPNYMQTWGLVRAFGGVVREWPLVFANRKWTVDCDALERMVTAKTKLIIICNPNNPTGARFEAEDLDRIAAAANRHGAWILSDEIYRGAELDGRETPSMWGRSDRVVVTSGLSKAYGLPGLRIGWIVGPPAFVAATWASHDYTTIAPGAVSDLMARRALAPTHRQRILARTRAILNENYPIIAEWLDARPALFTYAPPDAGAIVYVRYHTPINSTELVTRLRVEKSLLIVPGDHFGMDHHLRIGFGEEKQYLRRALERIEDLGLRIADQSTVNPQSAFRNPQ